jgi:UDP-N-acetyl-2-amino-2-deoxyglucuronate dehydrogenase
VTVSRIAARPGILLIGCGVVGDVHANALAELAQRGRASLAGVMDLDAARAESYGRRWDVPWSSSLKEALRWPDIDVVHVCVPSGLHATIGISAAQAGKHVLVEKPIDVTLAAADRLIEACHTAGVGLSVVSQHRFDPGFRELQAIVTAGGLGRLVLGEARVKWYRSQAYYESAAWRGTRALDGGGALINQSIHYVDLLLALCGPVDRVNAVTATAAHSLEVEDVAAVLLRFRQGATGTILGSTAIFPGLSERLEISGTNGTAILEDGALTYLATPESVGEIGSHGTAWRDLAHKGRAAPAPHEPPYGGRHTDQIEDFLDALTTGRPPTVTAQDGRAALALVLAAYQAAASGREVPVENP